jgi:hypothetical protein
MLLLREEDHLFTFIQATVSSPMIDLSL